LKGLGQIVVCAQFETHDAVGFLSLGGQHQDRDIGHRPDAPARLEAVEIGQHHIENDGVGRIAPQRRQTALGGGRKLDGETASGKIVAEHGGEPRIVVDDQDFLRHAARSPFRPFHLDSAPVPATLLNTLDQFSALLRRQHLSRIERRLRQRP
jgi:hypothetical protein